MAAAGHSGKARGLLKRDSAAKTPSGWPCGQTEKVLQSCQDRHPPSEHHVRPLSIVPTNPATTLLDF